MKTKDEQLEYRRRLWAKHKEKWNAERRKQRAADNGLYRLQQNEWHRKNKERVNAKRRLRRQKDEEHRHKLIAKAKASYERTREKQLAYKREWAKSHREERRAQRRLHYEENKEKILAKNKNYAESDRGKSVLIPAQRAFYEKHKEKIIARSTARSNTPEGRALQAAYRAKKFSAAVGDRKAYADFLRWARITPSIPCYYCGVETTPGGHGRHCDHMIPVVRQGMDCISNLCICCLRCNSMKGKKTPEEFRVWLRIAEPSHPFAA